MIILIRPAIIDDLNTITEIYNEVVLNTNFTLDTEVKPIDYQISWFKAHQDRYPLLVAEIDSRIVGWCSLSPWSDRGGYEDTAEISTYVHSEFRGKGVGRKLKETAINTAKTLGLHCIISRVVGENHASKLLNNKLGFRHVGTMQEVGKKFGRLHDVDVYQLLIT